MFDDEKVLDDTQEDVVDSQEIEEIMEEDISEDIDDNEESEKKTEVAEPDKSKQSKEENSAYAKMRRKAEEEAKQKFENERKQLEEEKKYIERQKEEFQQHNYKNELLRQITPELIEKIAYEHGVTHEYARTLLELQVDKQVAEKKEADYKQKEIINKQKAELRQMPFFNELEKDIDEAIRNNPNVDVKTAYYFFKGQKADELKEKASKMAEKRTIANMQDKARRSVVGGGDSSDNSKVELSNDEIEMAIAFGHDPRKIKQRISEAKKKKG